MRTDVTALLDHLGVSYVVKQHDQPALTAVTAAQERGVRISQIVKCMVGETDTGDLVVMLIPGDKKLKSSKVRKRLGAASLQLVTPDRLAAEHGLEVGAISPLQLLDDARMMMDPAVLNEPLVDISSGDAMAGIELTSDDLLRVVEAELIEMTSTRN